MAPLPGRRRSASRQPSLLLQLGLQVVVKRPRLAGCCAQMALCKWANVLDLHLEGNLQSLAGADYPPAQTALCKYLIINVEPLLCQNYHT